MRRYTVLILALALCVACGQPASMRQSQTVDGLTITLEHPRELPINREQEMTITLMDASGKPVDGAIVALDLVMPAMPMGQNKPLADPLGGGRYRVRAAYSMLGDWKTTVRATINGKAYEATFDQVVVE
ncbi:MAG TPA: FixH family protein [Roseiflexaceae bacterium]|nr:FixH family protein [Roseiflexaceae bacterium]